jgi:hypothetical protein
MFGWGYAIDFCVSLFQDLELQKAKDQYFAECMRMICENTAKMVGGEYVRIKLSEMLYGEQNEGRTAEEIIDTIRKKLE